MLGANFYWKTGHFSCCKSQKNIILELLGKNRFFQVPLPDVSEGAGRGSEAAGLRFPCFFVYGTLPFTPAHSRSAPSLRQGFRTPGFCVRTYANARKYHRILGRAENVRQSLRQYRHFPNGDVPICAGASSLLKLFVPNSIRKLMIDSRI